MNIVFGLHSVTALLNESNVDVVSVMVAKDKQSSKLETIMQLCRKHNIQVEVCAKDILDSLAGNGNHQGVVAKVANKPLQLATLQEVISHLNAKPHSMILVLDGVTDNHNLGAIVRTAECLGVDALVLPKDNSANPHNSTVNKVSCGAIHSLPIIVVTNINRTLQQLKDEQYWIVGTSLSPRSFSLFDYTPTNRMVVVLGSEDKGMRRLVEENCDYLLTIPMVGKVQSLNVSVAAGIVLSHLKYRQQL